MKAKKDQFRRFLEAARELGADETGVELERAFKKIVPPKSAKDALVPKKDRLRKRRVP